MKDSKFEIFQYLSAIIEPASLLRLLNRTISHSNIILDLEDSIWDVFDEDKTSALKGQARENLEMLLAQFPQLQIGIRINPINSKTEFAKDLTLLQALNDVSWKYIVLPKVESSSELQSYLDQLKDIRFKEIIICIESVQGIKNLKNILENNRSQQFSRVQFGHFDYFLDADIFPIPHQSEYIFWETCQNLAEVVESHGYSYLHSPLNTLNSQKLMHAVINKLHSICTNKFGIATISMEQTLQLAGYKENAAEALVLVKRSDDKMARAKKIIDLFTKTNTKFSFHHKTPSGTFIPPHEYLAAKKFFQDHEQ